MAKKCPIRGEKLVDIIYGMPPYKVFEAAERNEVYIGGCMMEEFA